MNLFKKTTATIALVALVSGIFSTGVSANSTSEIEAANALAAAGYINNHSDNAAAYNLNQNVLRQEIAAVARGIAGLEKKATCDNEFSDVTATTPNTWACYSVEALADADLIAKNDKFNPENEISKAEAVGMMVKAAFGSEYAYDSTKAASWQEQVVDFAVSKGVVASFTNYNTPATRGFVFEAGNNAMVASTEVADACDEVSQLLGLCGDTTDTMTDTTTDTTDTTTPAVAADFEVSTSPDSLADGTQIPNKGIVRFAKVDFTAGSEDVSVNTVEISKTTLASIPSSTRIWFEKNGKRVSGKAAFTSDNIAIVSFAPAYVIMAGETETLDLYVELDTAQGNDFQFMGKVIDSSVSTESTFVTPKLTTATYTVAPAVVAKLGSTATYTDLSTAVELGKFSVKNNDATAETRDISFQSVTLRQLGDADLVNLSDIYLERLGKKVSTDTVVDGKYVTFTINDVIKDSTTATYYVKGLVSTVDNNSGDTYKFEIKKDTDLDAVEVETGFRSSVIDNATSAAVSNLELFQYKVLGSDITFSRDESVELSQNVAKGTTSVTLLKGTISATEAITLEDPTIGFTIDGATATGANDLFNNIYLKIGSTVMSYTPASTDTSAAFLGLATLNAGTTDVEIYADIKDTAPAKTFKFNDLKLSDFTTAEYVSNQNTISSSVGSVSGISVSIDSTALSANKVDGLGNTTLATGSKNVLLNELELKVNQGNPVSISNAEYTVTYSGSASNNAFITLYVDGQAVQTKTFSGTTATTGTVSFETLSAEVSDTPVRLAVKADFSDAYSAGDFSVKLTGLEVSDTLTSVTVALPTIANSAVFSVAQAEGLLSSSDNNPNAKLLLAGSTAEQLLAFRVQAKNDDIKLRDLVFTGTNLDSLNNFKVTDSNGNVVVDSATTTNATSVEFTNLNVTDSIAQDSIETFYLVADVNLNTSVASVVVNLDGAQSNIKSSNGTIIAMGGNVTSVTSNAHRIEENMAVVAKDSNGSKDIATSAIRFSVTASGKDQATLSGVTVKATLSGYTGATQIAIYKDSVSTANLMGTGAYSNNADVFVNIANLANIDAGSTNHYIVAIESAVVDSTANSSDWTVSINDVTVNLGAGDVKAVDYDNMGTFPMTEVK